MYPGACRTDRHVAFMFPRSNVDRGFHILPVDEYPCDRVRCLAHHITFGESSPDMRRTTLLLALQATFALHGQIDIPLQWSTCSGGTAWESALGVTALADGGCVLTGFSYSWLGATDFNHGGSDFWVSRLTADGVVAWQRSLGGSLNDVACAAVELPNGDIFIAGYTESPSGEFGNGPAAIVVRISATGAVLSFHRYGGALGAKAHDLRATPDGGFILVGSTASSDGDIVGHHGGTGVGGTPTHDAWLVKADANGVIEWQLPLGGTGYDVGNGVVIAADGAYMISGYTNSNNGDVPDLHLGGAELWEDMWVAKVSTSGNLLWARAIGGSETEYGDDISATSDGGAVVVGHGESGNGDLQGFGWATGMLAAKVSADGDLLWLKRIPNNDMNNRTSIVTDDEGHHWLAASTPTDLRIVELGVNGGTQQNQTYGGSDAEYGTDIVADALGLFVVATTTSNDGDVSGNHGNADGWVLRFATDLNGVAEVVQPRPMVIVGGANIAVDMGPLAMGRTCEIFDAAGRMIKTVVLDQRPQTIATNDLATGSYCAVVRTASGRLHARFEILQ